MERAEPIWLVENASSGSNSEEALDALRGLCTDAGYHVVQRSCFPDEDLPTPAMLDAAEVQLVAVFTGDGTVNALVERLAGWSGAVLVLPGGTMNLLFHRLHGDRSLEEVVEAAAEGRTRRVRPAIIRTPAGDALAELLAGPGTSWNEVREDLREHSVGRMLEDAAEALDGTLSEPGVACREPRLGRAEGYPLLLLDPRAEAIEISAFYAEGLSDLLAQGWALLRRNFREGPHEVIGTPREVVVESVDGGAFGILLDGEPAEVESPARFELVPCEVELLATVSDGF